MSDITTTITATAQQQLCCQPPALPGSPQVQVPSPAIIQELMCPPEDVLLEQFRLERQQILKVSLLQEAKHNLLTVLICASPHCCCRGLDNCHCMQSVWQTIAFECIPLQQHCCIHKLGLSLLPSSTTTLGCFLQRGGNPVLAFSLLTPGGRQPANSSPASAAADNTENILPDTPVSGVSSVSKASDELGVGKAGVARSRIPTLGAPPAGVTVRSGFTDRTNMN